MPRSVEENLDHPRGLPDEAEFRRPDDEFGVEVYVALREAVTAREAAEQAIAVAVNAAQAHGVSWGTIGILLGVGRSCSAALRSVDDEDSRLAMVSVARALLTQPYLHRPFFGAAEDRQLDLAISRRVERLEQILRVASRRPPRRPGRPARGRLATLGCRPRRAGRAIRRRPAVRRPAAAAWRRGQARLRSRAEPAVSTPLGKRVHACSQALIRRDREVETFA